MILYLNVMELMHLNEEILQQQEIFLYITRSGIHKITR